MITWDDSMETGVRKINLQHQKLINKYNELYEAVSTGRGRAVIGDILDFLQFYVVWHFGEEEECMESYRCPVAQANKHAHDQFVARFDQFYTDWQVASLNADEVQDACNELGNWIENHLRRIDSQLSSCVHD